MTTIVALNHKVHIGALDMTAYTESLNISDLSIVAVPFTNFAAGGFPEMKPGMKSGACTVNTFQDMVAAGPDEVFSAAQLAGSQFPISCDPCPTGTSTAGDPAWFSRGYIAKHQPVTGSIGDAAKNAVELTYDTVILRGLVAHPSAARTANGTGTACVLTGPSATQKLYSGLHVVAYSGFTNVVFTVESDDNIGFSSPTTRATLTTVTATTSQFQATPGGWATETHHRMKWVVTGAGSITFIAYLAVL